MFAGGQSIQHGYSGQRDDLHIHEARFHHTNQNCIQFETYETLISGIFPFNLFGLQLIEGN
jgi:hypothetical protein